VVVKTAEDWAKCPERRSKDMRMRTVSVILLVFVLAIALPVTAQKQVADRPSFKLLQSLDDAKVGKYNSLVAIAYGSKSADAGVAARTLGHYSNKVGNAQDAYGWWDIASRCGDRKAAAEALGCQGYLLVRWGDRLSAAKKFQAAAERSGDTAVKSEMNHRTGECYVNLAVTYPAQPQCDEYKREAARYFALSGTEASKVDGLAIRLELIWGWMKNPTDIAYAIHPFTDRLEPWLIDAKDFVATTTDQDAKATVMIMIAEVYFNNLGDYETAKVVCKKINASWQDHRTQAAWSRIVWGGCFQDQARYKEAREMYLSIPRDFNNKDNFRGNDVCGLAKDLAKICDQMQKEKEVRK